MPRQKVVVETQRKKCRKCGRMADAEAFFSRNRKKMSDPNRTNVFGEVYVTTAPGYDLAGHHRRRTICIGCELSARNDPSLAARAKRKAQNTLRAHAEKYGMRTDVFARKYGWHIDRMVYNILHDHDNTCVYCWFPYGEMGHGLDDLTFDVIDPEKEPFYQTNVQRCCRTCNQEKASLPPELWARRLIEWREYRDWMAQIRDRPTYGLPLFEPPTLQ
jgi:hypothetical protein